MAHLKDFWYIACESRALKKNKILSCKILDEWIVLFRDEQGKPVALKDYCLHRNSRLSQGKVRQGRLICGYHGWTYNASGQVVHIPSEGKEDLARPIHCSPPFLIQEKQDYIYICLNPESSFEPFTFKYYQKPGYKTIRLINFFYNNVLNCAENFVNIPHTLFVHPGIFRTPKYQKLQTKISRKKGEVHSSYFNETDNLGWFAKFLNPEQQEIKHTDSYYFPNVTCVEYQMSQKRHFLITSQSIPQNDTETLVYTDLTYNYGIWNTLSAPIIYWYAQTIIRQDREILKNQMETILKYGSEPKMGKADLIYRMMQTLWEELEAGRDPFSLPEKQLEMEFWI